MVNRNIMTTYTEEKKLTHKELFLKLCKESEEEE